MEKIELNVIGISSSQTQAGAYALILSEKDGKRRLPIIIGSFEAQAIAIELEKMKPQRPLTHDLFRSFALAHQIIVKDVMITKFMEGIFFAEIHSLDINGNEVATDARTSDAIALALRFNCPVYTNEDVLSKTGIYIDPQEQEPIEEEKSSKNEPNIETNPFRDLKDYSVDALKSMLQDAVNGENYELASRIRDEINSRKKND